MKTFFVLLSLALVVAAFAFEEMEVAEDDAFVKRAMDDLNQFMKRGRGTFFSCQDEYGNANCICKMRRGKQQTISCF